MVGFAASLHSTIKTVLLHSLDDLHLHHQHECHVEFLAVSHINSRALLSRFCILDSNKSFLGKDVDHFAQIVKIFPLTELIETSLNSLIHKAEEHMNLLRSMLDHMTHKSSQF